MSGVQTDGLRHVRDMSLNRLAFAVLTYLYFFACGACALLYVCLTFYTVFSLGLTVGSRLAPRRPVKLALFCAIVADVGMISAALHLGGGGEAALFPLYLWMILGNGFRIGNQALFLASAMSCLGFAAVVASTPYWASQPSLSLSLLLALLVLPAYSSTLISKLSRAREQAEAANRAKSMFLAAISHELRTPLNAILGSVSLIEDTKLDDEQQSLFTATRAGTAALLSLIGGILDFSRAEAGLMPLSHELVDLPALLVEIRDLIAMQARLKSLRVSIHAAPSVPPRIMGSRKTLMEVLLNLASNAVKFTETGGICIAVALEPQTSAQPAKLRFEVSDTGIGVADEAQARIFDVFSQADASILDRFGGSGLGLALCRQLVTLMGGEIGVESAAGQGSTFWFTARCGEAEQHEGSTDSTVIRPGAAAVLLCDETALAEAIGVALRAQGLAVRHVGALQTLRDAPSPEGLEEILFLYRRDAAGDLAADCAILEQIDPRGVMPCVLLASPASLSECRETLRRRFVTAMAIPAPAETLRRACLWAIAATNKPSAGKSNQESNDARRQKAIGFARLHVLVADDNAINRQVLGRILERSGHRVTMALNGGQALDAMEAQPFDVVLMDVNMPVMNGLEATRLFRLGASPDQPMPIIALTADATAETEARCVEAGMDGCITKPFTPARLAAKIEELVRPASPASGKELARITDHPRFASRLPCLDPGVLAELRSLGGEDFVASLLEDFVTGSDVLIGRIQNAVEARDMAGFRFELHALCSGAANLGATALLDGAAARDMTEATLATAGPVLLHRLRHELARIEREWQGLCATPPISRRMEDS